MCHNRRINHFQLYINSKLSDHYWCSFVLVVRISLRPSRRPSFHIFPWESIEKARDRLSDQGRDLGTQVVQGYGSCYHPLAFFALAVLRSKRFTLEKFENLQQRRVCRLLNWEAGGVGKHVKDQRKILIVTKITKIFLIFNIFGGILFFSVLDFDTILTLGINVYCDVNPSVLHFSKFPFLGIVRERLPEFFVRENA